MPEEENVDLEEQLKKNKALFVIENDGNTVEEKLKPTPENLRAALGKATVKTEKHLHAASGIEFTLQAMSSQGYTALHNVELLSPDLTRKLSSNADDEHQRNIVYLTYGVAEPKLTPQDAEAILRAPGWGPSNITLIDAIQLLNPAAQERMNDYLVMTAFCRFTSVLFEILRKTGTWAQVEEHLELKPEVRKIINDGFDVFNKLFQTEQSAAGWGIPLTTESLVESSPEAPVDKVADTETPPTE